MFASLVARTVAARPSAVARPSAARLTGTRTAAKARSFATEARHNLSEDEVEALVAMTNPLSDVPAKLASAALSSAQPSAVTVTHYLDFLQEQRKFDQVSEFFDSYSTKRKPNARMWTSVIRAACQAGNLTKALKYLEQWKADGSSQPTARAYASLISECARAPDAGLAKGQALFEEMKSRGIEPTNLVYHALIVLNLAVGSRDAIENLRNEIKNKGLIEHPLTQQALARAELLSSLPKLSRKDRTPQQIANNQSITGVKLPTGAELSALEQSILNKIRGRELAAREAMPRKPDDYVDVSKDQLPEEWTEEDKQEALAEIADLNKDVLARALAAQKEPAAPQLVPSDPEQLKSVFVPTFFWTLHNQLRVLNANPAHFGLSAKSQELVAKYLQSLKPKAKKH